MKDWRGVDIQVGDRIVYAVKSSTSINLVEAVVNSVDNGLDVVIIRRNNDGIKTAAHLGSGENVTVVYLPNSPKTTLVENNIAKEQRRQLILAQQAACDHDWVAHSNYHYPYRSCNICHKIEYLTQLKPPAPRVIW